MTLIGYRAFLLDFRPARVGLTGVVTPWESAEMEAFCKYSSLSLADCHAAGYAKHDFFEAHPEMKPYRATYSDMPREHECGIYSFKSALSCWQEMSRWGDEWMVIAEVENYGDLVVETERGYRASKTRIREVFYLAPKEADAETTVLVTRALARKYVVPVTATSSHLLLKDDPDYVDWVGRQQVEATDRLLRPSPYDWLMNQIIQGGLTSWQTSGSLSGLTQTSLTLGSSPSIPSAWTSPLFLSAPPSRSRLERFIDWVMLDAPMPLVVGGVTGIAFGLSIAVAGILGAFA